MLGCLIDLGCLLAFWLAAGVTPLGTGVSAPPWVKERMEEKLHDRVDFRTPIRPPVREGFPPPTCDDPPDEARILRALPALARGEPGIYTESRENLQIVTELLIDKIDAPRFFPLVGPAQLHHCHWKCTVYYDEVTESSYPFPMRSVRPFVQVIYMHMDHLHLCEPEAMTQPKQNSGPAVGP